MRIEHRRASEHSWAAYRRRRSQSLEEWMSTESIADLDGLKARIRGTWMSGDYDRIAQLMVPAAVEFISQSSSQIRCPGSRCGVWHGSSCHRRGSGRRDSRRGRYSSKPNRSAWYLAAGRVPSEPCMMAFPLVHQNKKPLAVWSAAFRLQNHSIEQMPSAPVR